MIHSELQEDVDELQKTLLAFASDHDWTVFKLLVVTTRWVTKMLHENGFAQKDPPHG